MRGLRLLVRSVHIYHRALGIDRRPIACSRRIHIFRQRNGWFTNSSYIAPCSSFILEHIIPRISSRDPPQNCLYRVVPKLVALRSCLFLRPRFSVDLGLVQISRKCSDGKAERQCQLLILGPKKSTEAAGVVADRDDTVCETKKSLTYVAKKQTGNRHRCWSRPPSLLPWFSSDSPSHLASRHILRRVLFATAACHERQMGAKTCLGD